MRGGVFVYYDGNLVSKSVSILFLNDHMKGVKPPETANHYMAYNNTHKC